MQLKNIYIHIFAIKKKPCLSNAVWYESAFDGDGDVRHRSRGHIEAPAKINGSRRE